VPKLATKVVSWLDVQKDDVILDLGCGGEFSSFSHLVEGGFNPSFHYSNTGIRLPALPLLSGLTNSSLTFQISLFDLC
jgi:hypothetical protein